MNQARIGELHQRLYAALDDVQGSYEMLKAGTFADDEMCQDLLEQLAFARSAVEAWQSFIKAGSFSH